MFFVFCFKKFCLLLLFPLSWFLIIFVICVVVLIFSSDGFLLFVWILLWSYVKSMNWIIFHLLVKLLEQVSVFIGEVGALAFLSLILASMVGFVCRTVPWSGLQARLGVSKHWRSIIWYVIWQNYCKLWLFHFLFSCLDFVFERSLLIDMSGHMIGLLRDQSSFSPNAWYMYNCICIKLCLLHVCICI